MNTFLRRSSEKRENKPGKSGPFIFGVSYNYNIFSDLHIIKIKPFFFHFYCFPRVRTEPRMFLKPLKLLLSMEKELIQTLSVMFYNNNECISICKVKRRTLNNKHLDKNIESLCLYIYR